jgi:hypothetical protein
VADHSGPVSAWTAVLGLTRYLATYWVRKNMARNDEYRGALLFLV